eukprot:TRINITY_DN8153_c0_g1_i1.p1 TRINITY_DN8153_c0_g1~~TRINITY_DN8153_c0_g1_i1.p1  ORF type:complete len:182 (-),score=1.57 TRINITY_DN8153_c0_g1_i1:42-587(-)
MLQAVFIFSVGCIYLVHQELRLLPRKGFLRLHHATSWITGVVLLLMAMGNSAVVILYSLNNSPLGDSPSFDYGVSGNTILGILTAIQCVLLLPFEVIFFVYIMRHLSTEPKPDLVENLSCIQSSRIADTDDSDDGSSALKFVGSIPTRDSIQVRIEILHKEMSTLQDQLLQLQLDSGSEFH